MLLRHYVVDAGMSSAYTAVQPRTALLLPASMAISARTDNLTGHSTCHSHTMSGAGSDEDTDWDRRHVIICSPGSAGCSGHLDVRLTWQSEEQRHPAIGADLVLDPLQGVCISLLHSTASLRPSHMHGMWPALPLTFRSPASTIMCRQVQEKYAWRYLLNPLRRGSV